MFFGLKTAANNLCMRVELQHFLCLFLCFAFYNQFMRANLLPVNIGQMNRCGKEMRYKQIVQ